MKFGKLFYFITSTVLAVFFVLYSEIFFPSSLSKGSVTTVKKIYFADHISSAHQKVIDKFNERYKGQIEVEAVNLPFTKFSTNERKELLARYFRSKSDRIDVFSVDQIWVPRFAKWGINMESYFPAVQQNNFMNFAIESCSYNDSLVAVPLYIDIALMYYRKDLIKTLPNQKEIIDKLRNSITWEDFLALNSQVRDKPFFTFQADDFEGLMCIFTELLESQNVSLLKDGKLLLNTPEAEKALQLLVDLVNKYGASPKQVVQFKENSSYNYFVKQNGYFLRGWPSFLDNFKQDESYEKLRNEIEKAPTPHFKGYPAVSIYGGWNLMISRFSTKIPEAVKFVRFAMSEEAQKILYEEGGYLPINNNIYKDSVYVKAHPDLIFYKKLLKNGVYRPFTKRYTNISDIISFYLNQAIRKKIPVKTALTRASEKINSETILLK